MKTNVSTLLREFPKVRRAALSGEDVIIETREGNLRLIADITPGKHLIGSMKGRFGTQQNDLTEPTTSNDDWKPSL